MADEEALRAFGERLRTLRQGMGLSAAKMAAMWNLERKTWERYEHGDGLPKANVLIDLAALGFSETWLLTGKGDMDAANVRASDTEQPAAVRVAAYNVAYLLAQESPHIKLDPEDFALTFRDLFDRLLEQQGGEAAPVSSLAVQRLLKGA